MHTISRITELKKTTTAIRATVLDEKLSVSSDDGTSVGSNTVEVDRSCNTVEVDRGCNTVEVDRGCTTVEVDGVGSCRSRLTRIFTTFEWSNSLPITSVKFATKGGKK